MKKTRKKKQVLKGLVQSGTIFIGDAAYMADNPQKYPEGIVPADLLNPFKDFDSYQAEHPEDHNLELPGSFNGDLPGRGVTIQTNLLSGSYTVTKRMCKETGKLLEIKIKFKG